MSLKGKEGEQEGRRRETRGEEGEEDPKSVSLSCCRRLETLPHTG